MMGDVTQEEDDPFPVDISLFTDTFCQETEYRLVGQDLKIRQVFGANLGVAAPVWDAVRLNCYSRGTTSMQCVRACACVLININASKMFTVVFALWKYFVLFLI